MKRILAVVCLPTLLLASDKLLPEDGAAEDLFGHDVDIGEQYCVVGAVYDDDNGKNSGSAYIFDLATGEQLHKLIPEDGGTNDQFGFTVSMNDEFVVIGAWFDDEKGEDAGAAYVFDVASGEQIAKLVAVDGSPGDRLGVTVDLDDQTAIVGAFHADEMRGAAYVFDVRSGAQLQKLLPDEANPADLFGRSVGISGNRAVVGAPQTDEFGFSSGSAYVFDITTGELLTKILAEDSQQGDQFGFASDMSDSLILVGARGDDDNGDGAGAAYLFDIDGNQITKIRAGDGQAMDRFGHAVTITGDIIGIGAWLDDDNGEDAGSAYFFDADGRFIAKLLADDGDAGDLFGLSVGIAEDRVIVSAQRDDDNGLDSGSAYVFELPCKADVNGDGTLDVLDFVAFQTLWQGNLPGGDCDFNGAFNVLDFICFQQAFASGCG